MRVLKMSLALLTALASHVVSAQTTNPSTLTTVAVPPAVTVTTASDPSPHYAGYVVTLTNKSNTTLIKVRMSGSITWTSGLTAASIQPDPDLPVECVIADTTFSCDFTNSGLVLAPGASKSFPVIVKVPEYNGTQDSDPSITLSSKAVFKNGNTSSSNPSSDATLLSNAKTSVVAQSITSVQSLVTRNGGTLRTGGADFFASLSDQWTTSVKVPGGFTTPTQTAYTTALITDSIEASSCASYAVKCFSSSLTIPGSFASLEITILWDDSAIKSGTKAENVKLYYFGEHPEIAYPIQVQLCSVDGGPSPGRPCQSSPPYRYSKQTDPNLPSYWGDIRFNVKALDNGKYIN
jgi:hypothetical protein